jgi:hypothetical protein
MNLFHTFKNTFPICGKNVEVTIRYHWEYEQESVDGDFDFGSEEANKEYLQRFIDGELACVLIRVSAHLGGLVGTDYLGMCHVRDGSVDDLMQAVCTHNMEFVALRELESSVQSLLSTFTKEDTDAI